MKRDAFRLLTTSILLAASARNLVSQDLFVRGNGRCMEAHPGDTVHYSLTIQGLANVRTVYADLQMRQGRDLPFRPAGLPAPDFRTMGGGGSTKADLAAGDSYQFSFTVPNGLLDGTYRGLGVTVWSNETIPGKQQTSYVDVSHRTLKEVRAYCLNVVGNNAVPATKPEVTGFQPGLVSPK